MPHHLPLLAMKQGAPTAMLNEAAEQPTVEQQHIRFLQFLRNEIRGFHNPNEFTRHCYKRYIVNSGDWGFEGFKITGQPYNCVCVGTVTSTKIFHENCNYFPICFHGQCVFGNILLPHVDASCLDMQTDPEKAVAFRQAIIQSNGRTLAFMARAIDEHSCDTIKSSPHRMYRNRNDKRLGLEFQKTWKNNFNSPNVCMDHIRYRRWPFQDSRFQQFYAEMPYPAESWSKHNPFGYEVWDYHLEEVRNDAGQPLQPVHCFMYFYRYNFARALLNLVEHAFVGEAEDQFPTFGEFVQSALGKHIQFVLKRVDYD